MKGKLYKESEGYYLSVSNKTIGTTRPLLNFDIIEYKLSLKNCQAVERGYDLDELAYHNSLSYTWLETDERDKTLMSKYGVEGFKAGFQKALELMGDKKFSVEDVILIAEYIRVASQSTPSVRTKDLIDEFIQSLQQTEWDVEVEMVKEHIGSGCYKKYPKLDDERCLILKKYKNG